MIENLASEVCGAMAESPILAQTEADARLALPAPDRF